MIKIESRNVGKLIGVRGGTIKQLQSDYNVRISISKEDDEDGMRTVDVQGEDRDVQNAIETINQRFIQEGPDSSYGSRPRYNNSDRNSGYQRSENRGGGGGYGRSYDQQRSYDQPRNYDQQRNDR